jgi:hypothetical protein
LSLLRADGIAVVDPTPELMKGLHRLFGRDSILLEAEA